MRVVHVRRSLRAAWLAVLLVVIALVAPSVASADVDLSNDWFVHFSSVRSFDCDLTFVQSGSALTANGDCRGSSPSATFTGTVDPQSGAFSLSGSIWTGAPFPYLYIVFAGAPSGDGSVLNGTATVDGSPGTFTASSSAGFCSRQLHASRSAAPWLPWVTCCITVAKRPS